MVSILARPFERALLPVGGINSVSNTFQSSPALSSGRYLLRVCVFPECIIVSILARPFERALPGTVHVDAPVAVFQSSPALSSGRYLWLGHAGHLAWAGFNPRPPFRAGATRQRSPRHSRGSCFNPRPPFRAGATREPDTATVAARGFNPRPPFRAGATGQAVAEYRGAFLFQSSPALSSGRYCRLVESTA